MNYQDMYNSLFDAGMKIAKLEDRIKELEVDRDKIVKFIDGVRNLARNRNPEGCTLLDFSAVWNEQYQKRIEELEAENKALKTKITDHLENFVCHDRADAEHASEYE